MKIEICWYYISGRKPLIKETTMDLRRPDPSKSSSTSPPENSFEWVALNSTCNKVTSNPPPTLIDHVQIKMCLSSNILSRKGYASIRSDINGFFHNTRAWLNHDGKIRPEKNNLSTNGRCLYCAQKQLPYTKPRKNQRIEGRDFNQLSPFEKLDIKRLSGDLKEWQWQSKLLASSLDRLPEAFANEFKTVLHLQNQPYFFQEYFKLSSIEFYREYEVGVDIHNIDTALQEAINQTVNQTIGNFVSKESYGRGAKKWFVNIFNGVRYKGLEIKSYVKGRFLRLEVQFKQIPEPKVAPLIETPIQTLSRIGALAEQILDSVHSNLKLNPQIIDEHELMATVLSVLPRSRYDKRVHGLIKSLAENLTYTPSAFGRDRATKHQLTKLIDAGIIEPIAEHFPSDTKRRRGLSFRICLSWTLNGGQQ
jgi:hypothetical protein